MTDTQERVLIAIVHDAPLPTRDGGWRCVHARMPTLHALERAGMLELLIDGNVHLARPTRRGAALVERWDRDHAAHMERWAGFRGRR